jgi:hypothetical protein
MKIRIVFILLKSIFVGVLFAESLELVQLNKIGTVESSQYSFNESKVPENHSYEGDRYPSGIFYLDDNNILIGNVSELLVCTKDGVITQNIQMPSEIHILNIFYASEKLLLISSGTYDDDRIYVIDYKGNIIFKADYGYVTGIYNTDNNIYIRAEGYGNGVKEYKLDLLTGELQEKKLENGYYTNPNSSIKIRKGLLLQSRGDYLVLAELNSQGKAYDNYISNLAFPITYNKEGTVLIKSLYYDKISNIVYLLLGNSEIYDFEKTGQYYLAIVLIK